MAASRYGEEARIRPPTEDRMTPQLPFKQPMQLSHTPLVQPSHLVSSRSPATPPQRHKPCGQIWSERGRLQNQSNLLSLLREGQGLEAAPFLFFHGCTAPVATELKGNGRLSLLSEQLAKNVFLKVFA